MGMCGGLTKDYADSDPSPSLLCFPQQRKEDFPALQEHMWLNKVKNKLNKKAYQSVQHFVEDMRLIFQNHSIFYKVRASALLSFFSEVSHFSSCQVDATIPLIMGQVHTSQRGGRIQKVP